MGIKMLKYLFHNSDKITKCKILKKSVILHLLIKNKSFLQCKEFKIKRNDFRKEEKLNFK